MKKLVLVASIACISTYSSAQNDDITNVKIPRVSLGAVGTNQTAKMEQDLQQLIENAQKRQDALGGISDSYFANEEARYQAEQARLAKLPCPRIGMTKAQGERTCWGKADYVSRTITAGRTAEQWVFGNGRYLYFTNDRLTTIQD